MHHHPGPLLFLHDDHPCPPPLLEHQQRGLHLLQHFIKAALEPDLVALGFLRGGTACGASAPTRVKNRLANTAGTRSCQVTGPFIDPRPVIDPGGSDISLVLVLALVCCNGHNQPTAHFGRLANPIFWSVLPDWGVVGIVEELVIFQPVRRPCLNSERLGTSTAPPHTAADGPPKCLHGKARGPCTGPQPIYRPVVSCSR